MANTDLDNLWQSLERELNARRLEAVPPAIPEAAVEPPTPLPAPHHVEALLRDTDLPPGELVATHAMEHVPSKAFQSMRALASSFNGTSAAYTALGFVAGMLAWHMVGFWSFVSDVVLHQPPKSRQLTVAANTSSVDLKAIPAGTSDLTTGSIAPATTPAPPQERCISVTRGAEEANVAAIDCKPHDPLRDAVLAPRGDRLPSALSSIQDANSWAQGTGIETQAVEYVATPPPGAPVSTLTANDVNLDLGGYPSTKLNAK